MASEVEFLWDASNHDWPRGPMDLARAKREGIAGFTHKSSEGSTFVDPYFADAMGRARSVGFAVLGAYHVLWPNNPTQQAAFWLATVNRIAPWWRDHPCWVWQIDAELFQNFNPYRAPTLAEINACGDWIVANAHVVPEQVPVYAPRWLFGDQLRGLRYPNLWSSAYVNGGGSPAQLYPGDGGRIWEPYSGMTPKVGQFTSSATIAGQSPADANGARVASPAALQALFLGKPTEVFMADLTEAQQQELLTAARHINAAIGQGQLSFEATIQGILGTVQALVNQGKQQAGQIVQSVAASKDAVLGYLAAHPTTIDLTDADKAEIVASIQKAFAEHGVNVDPEPLLNALNARLAA